MIFSIHKYDGKNNDASKKYRVEFHQMMKEFFASPAVLHNVPESHFEKTISELENGTPYFDVYIFEADGKIAGYGAVTKTYSNEAGGLCYWFDEIYIREEFRGQGLGSAFIKQVIAENPDVKRFRLETEPENEAAVRLYKKLGFEPLEERQFTGLTLGISEGSYDKILKELAECRHRIMSIVAEDKQIDRVYRVNMQVFPLTEKIK